MLSCGTAVSETHNDLLIRKAQIYLNSLNNTSATFIQKDHKDNVQSGNFILANAHDVRWEYKQPRNIVITFCNNKIIYHDKELNNQETYSIENPFIEFIATRPINLKSQTGFYMKELKDKDSHFEIIISNVKKSVGSFILVFNKNPIKLNALVVFDDFGNPIELSFSNIINYHKVTTPLFSCGSQHE
jgi:outer membrane lipoprotein-sorting protein